MDSTSNNSGVTITQIIDDGTGTTTIGARVHGRVVTVYSVPIAMHNEVVGALKLVGSKQAKMSILNTFSPFGITWKY